MSGFVPRTTVELENGVVRLIDRIDGTELILLSDIVIVGESTDFSGPDFDDWFLSVATRETWFDVPVTSYGFGTFFKELGAALGFAPELKLGPPICVSRVLWPSMLEAQDMFQYKSSWLGFQNTQTYTDAIWAYIYEGDGHQ